MFVGVHVMLAEMTKTPELALSMEEGDAFMTSAQNVMRHYSVETTQKTLDWIAFGGVAVGQIYGPRLVALAMRKREESKAERSGKVIRPAAFNRAAPDANPILQPDAFAGPATEEGFPG